MKRIVLFVLLSTAALICFGCATKLEISNMTSYDLDLISWEGYWFGNDSVWDDVLGMYIDGLHPGSSDEQEVEPGNSPVYFWFAFGGPEYRTADFVEVDKREKAKFTLTDWTIVYWAGLATPSTVRDLAPAAQTKTLEKGSGEERYGRYRAMKAGRP